MIITFVLQTVLRIWDCLFHEGGKILFRVALTLIMNNKERILKCTTFADMLDLFKHIVTDSNTLRCHQFMQVLRKFKDVLGPHQDHIIKRKTTVKARI